MIRWISSRSSRRNSPMRARRAPAPGADRRCGARRSSRRSPSPIIPGDMRSEESFTSFAFSPKIAVRSFSSGDSSVSPLGVILPQRMSPLFTRAPMRTMPRSSRSSRFSSATFGISRVISSMPRLVSRTWSSSSWMWMDVKRSSRTRRSEITMASSKLYPYHGMKATRTLRPSAQFAPVGRRTVGNDVALAHLCARGDPAAAG